MSSTKTYSAIITDIGKAKIVSAIAQGKKVNILTLAVGDGNGGYYIPEPDMKNLKRQVWSGPVQRYEIMPESPNVIEVKAIIPYNIGGFTTARQS